MRQLLKRRHTADKDEEVTDLKEIKRYTDNDGRRMVLVDDGTFVIVGSEEAFQKNEPVSVSLGSVGSQFDPRQPTIGDLVASQKQCPDSACAKAHAALNTPCLEPRACHIIASMNQNGSAHFDPMKSTIGSLVGAPLGASQRTVDAAATVTEDENSSAHFDPKKATVGDLTRLNPVHGHVSFHGTARAEPGDIAVHPRNIRMGSR